MQIPGGCLLFEWISLLRLLCSSWQSLFNSCSIAALSLLLISVSPIQHRCPFHFYIKRQRPLAPPDAAFGDVDHLGRNQRPQTHTVFGTTVDKILQVPIFDADDLAPVRSARWQSLLRRVHSTNADKPRLCAIFKNRPALSRTKSRTNQKHRRST